jgi:hypothetical protein
MNQNEFDRYVDCCGRLVFRFPVTLSQISNPGLIFHFPELVRDTASRRASFDFLRCCTCMKVYDTNYFLLEKVLYTTVVVTYNHHEVEYTHPYSDMYMEIMYFPPLNIIFIGPQRQQQQT